MRIRALSIAAAILSLMAAPAFAQSVVSDPEGWELSTTATLATGRIFADQGFVLTEEPVIELDATACRDAVCVGIWRAQSLVGDNSVHETDFTVAYSFAAGDNSLEIKAGVFELPGPEVIDVSFSATRDVSDVCAATGSVELMRGGFEDTVFKAQLGCTAQFNNSNLGWDASSSVIHSDWSGNASFGYQALLYYQYNSGVRLTAGVKGFVSDEAGQVGFVSISRSF